ncbi:hypothetical protein D2L64_00740 [Micromonospora radicis]|uniref:Uncharacterized protein n=1 Tax=Micromonospora radicis TaxID=1894971 RepID=A0A418N1H6_9ACTN|nr:hypothetical protein D2L64_00740 [Micromonospora radicis]
MVDGGHLMTSPLRFPADPPFAGPAADRLPNAADRMWHRPVPGAAAAPAGPAEPSTTGGPAEPSTTGGPAEPSTTGGPAEPSTTGGPAELATAGGRGPAGTRVGPHPDGMSRYGPGSARRAGG